MPIVSPELDIFNLYPKKQHVSVYPLFNPNIDYETTAPAPSLLTHNKGRGGIRPINNENPHTNGVPLHIGRPYDTQQFFAPIEEGNKMGTPAEILQSTYLNQLMPSDVNMAARTNETGLYPYFMNQLHELENMIKNKPIASEPQSQPDVVNPVEPLPTIIEESVPSDTVKSPVHEEVAEGYELEEMVRSKKGRGGARPGSGPKPKYNKDDILEKPEKMRTRGEKAFLRRIKKQ